MENRQLLKWQPWLFLILGFFFPFQQAKTWKCHNIYLQSVAIGKLLVWSIIELQCHFPTYLHKQDTQYLPPFLVPKDLITVHLEINDQKVYQKSRTKSKRKVQRGISDFMELFRDVNWGEYFDFCKLTTALLYCSSVSSHSIEVILKIEMTNTHKIIW